MHHVNQSQTIDQGTGRDAAIQIIDSREQQQPLIHFKTTINCAAVPCYEAVKTWAARPQTVVIDSYELTAREADLRAMRLFARLGALGCNCNHMTQPA